MKKALLYIFSAIAISFLFAPKASAVCPICTIAVGAGVGFSRWLGIDDAITGLWIGGLIVSIVAWTLSWFDIKNIQFKGKTIITTLGYYLIIVIPLYFAGILGNSQNSLLYFSGLHFDKLILGIIAGSIGFWFGVNWYDYLKEKNNGRAHFPYQKVVMPVSPLIILSIIFYFITK